LVRKKGFEEKGRERETEGGREGRKERVDFELVASPGNWSGSLTTGNLFSPFYFFRGGKMRRY